MQWITVATPPFGSIEQFDEVVDRVGDRPEGLQARYAGSTEDGTLRVISFWASKAHADRFMSERLGPALAAVLDPEPVGTPGALGIEVARSYTPEPVS